MARGFLAGALWGGVLSVGVAGVASITAPPPQPPQASTLAPAEARAPTAGTLAQSDTNAGQSTADGASPSAVAAPRASAPAPDTLTSLDEETVASVRAPETGQADDLNAPAAPSQTGAVTLEGEEPIFPNPQALAPMAPQDVEELSISTEPAQPPQPSAEPVQGAFGSQDSAQVTPEPSGEAQDAEVSAVPSDTEGEEEMAQEPAEPAPLAPPSITQPQAPEVADAAPEEDDQLAMVAPSTGPQIGTPVVPLTERNTGAAVNRVFAQPEAETAGDGASDERPITAFEEPFDNPENKPLMSIVLIDSGDSPTSGAAGIAALRSFPYPISFAVDSAKPDAAERMALFRSEGFEVLAMVDLPEGAAPSDAETTLGSILPQLDEVVGVLEGTQGGLQGSREVADQVTAILLQSGHGLVTQDKGLNTMPKLARKEGVPATPVFRDFDSKDQKATVIRRFLDQAAFKAGQEGSVIMLGRLRPDTISALLLWGLQDRAGQVALAPVSAVLTQEGQ